MRLIESGLPKGPLIERPGGKLIPRLEYLKQKRKEMLERKTRRELGGITVSTTEKTETSILPTSAPGATGATQVESLEGHLETIRRGGLDSMTLLKSSANRLMRLMEETVTDQDLQSSRDLIRKVDPYSVQTAVSCAKQMTEIVKAQTNLLKILKDIRG